MNSITWDVVLHWLPWVLLGAALLAYYDMWRDGWHKRVQKASHQFAKMGSKTITDLLDAIARSDRPAIAHIIEQVIEHYGGEKGALLFGWEVFDYWIDDALDDSDYADRVGKRLEEVILGKIVSPEQQLALGNVATNFGKLGLKVAQGFFQGFATGRVGPVRDAIRTIISNFSTPDAVDEQIAKMAPSVIEGIKKDRPDLVEEIKKSLLSAEEKAKITA